MGLFCGGGEKARAPTTRGALRAGGPGSAVVLPREASGRTLRGAGVRASNKFLAAATCHAEELARGSLTGRREAGDR